MGHLIMIGTEKELIPSPLFSLTKPALNLKKIK